MVVVSGEMDLASVGELRSELLGALSRGPVVIDMREITFCDSAGLRTILEAHRYAETSSTTFRIAAPSTAVTRVLQLTGADSVLVVVPDADTALGDAE